MLSRRSPRLASKNKRAQLKRQELEESNAEDGQEDLMKEFVVVEKSDELLTIDEEKLDHHNPDGEMKLRKYKGRFAALLFFLYFLQGMPLGLTGAVPFLMSSKKVSYSDQGNFSFAFWPFSIKLLWAPFVDAVYSKRFGRRKSWVIPIQALTGFYLIWFAKTVKSLLEADEQFPLSSFKLSSIFFFLTFLSATQDIAVDGWGLEMFVKEDVSWTATCESVGKTFGWFIGNVIFLVFESADFSNQFIRPFFGLQDQDHGLVTIDDFMIYFGVVYLISTLYVLFFVHEFGQSHLYPRKDKEAVIRANELSIRSTYGFIWGIIKIPPMKLLIFILLTFRIGFLVKSASFFKLIEAGVSKEKLGLLALPLTPIEIIMPVIINRMIANQTANPFKYFTQSYCFKLLATVLVSYWVYLTPMFRDPLAGDYPFSYYTLTLLIQIVNSFVNYALFVPFSWFFARISDNTIGGTYLTFLNTMFNLGSSWMTTSSLYLMEFLNFKYCNYQPQLHEIQSLVERSSLSCLTAQQSEECISLGGTCETWIDPFYLQSGFCFLAGIAWIIFFQNSLAKLANTPDSAWKLFKSKRA